MNPYFSVLIPAYNQVGLMDKCIESLKNQTFTDFEVIMVNDGSTDDTADMLADFCESDARFSMYSHTKNGSLVAARLTGMEHAKGEYVFFLDSDDYIETDAFATLKAELENNPVDVLRFGCVSEPSGDVLMPYETDDPIAAYMDLKMPPAIWKNCYSMDVVKKVLDKAHAFYCNMGEDSYFTAMFFSMARSFGTLNKAIYHYVTGAGMSTTTSASTMKKLRRDYESIKLSGENLVEFIDKYNPKYSDKARRTVRHMHRYILCQNILFAATIKEAIEYCLFYKEEGLDALYEFGADVLIPYKVKFDLKATYKDIELENLLDLLPEKDA